MSAPRCCLASKKSDSRQRIAGVGEDQMPVPADWNIDRLREGQNVRDELRVKDKDARAVSRDDAARNPMLWRKKWAPGFRVIRRGRRSENDCERKMRLDRQRNTDADARRYGRDQARRNAMRARGIGCKGRQKNDNSDVLAFRKDAGGVDQKQKSRESGEYPTINALRSRLGAACGS